MKGSRRLSFMLVVLSVLLIAIAAWSRGRLTAAHAKAQEAAESLAESRSVISRIGALRDERAVREDKPDRDREVIGLIERSAAGSGIDRTSLARISPETPRRVADTDYAEHRVLVALRQVELDQLLRFLHEVADDGAGLRAQTVHLRVPQNPAADSQWNADTTFAYVSSISNPIKAGAQAGP
jgi:hypothetical protein